MLDTTAGGQKWRGAYRPGNHTNNTGTVLTVFETFASNNMRKRTIRSLAEAYHVAIANPWSDAAITFNASDEPKFRTARAPAALVLSPIVDDFRLTKVLMDGGSGLNLIYEETLQKMEIDWSRIEQSSTTFGGIIPRQNARCAGKITTRCGIRHAGELSVRRNNFPGGPFQQWISRPVRGERPSCAFKLYLIMGI